MRETKKDRRWYHPESEEDRSRDGCAVSTGTRESSGRQPMKFMTKLAGGELCLSQGPHNQEGAARIKMYHVTLRCLYLFVPSFVPYFLVYKQSSAEQT